MLKKFIHITRSYAHSKLTTLTVSDGDLGFAASIASRFVDGRYLTATTYDSHDDLLKIYPEAEGNLERLKSLSVNVIHNLAVQNLSTDKRLAGKKFLRILNNFPHSGFVEGLSETEPQMIKRHQDLVISPFLQHAAKMLYPNGQIHITHKATPPFSNWDIVKIAETHGLKLLRQTNFNPNRYPGYRPKCGAGKTPNKGFRVGKCVTYKFVLKRKLKHKRIYKFVLNSDKSKKKK